MQEVIPMYFLVVCSVATVASYVMFFVRHFPARGQSVLSLQLHFLDCWSVLFLFMAALLWLFIMVDMFGKHE